MVGWIVGGWISGWRDGRVGGGMDKMKGMNCMKGWMGAQMDGYR